MSTTKPATTPGAVLGFLVGLAVVPWSGFVVLKLWGWFLVPLGVPNVNLAHAMGMTLIAHFMTSQPHVKEKAYDEWWMRTAINIVNPLYVLGLGWLFHSFMN
jgi:hypothetical protein